MKPSRSALTVAFAAALPACATALPEKAQAPVVEKAETPMVEDGAAMAFPFIPDPLAALRHPLPANDDDILAGIYNCVSPKRGNAPYNFDISTVLNWQAGHDAGLVYTFPNRATGYQSVLEADAWRGLRCLGPLNPL